MVCSELRLWVMRATGSHRGHEDKEAHNSRACTVGTSLVFSWSEERLNPLRETLLILPCCCFSVLHFNDLEKKTNKTKKPLPYEESIFKSQTSPAPQWKTSILFPVFVLFAPFAYWNLIGLYILWCHKKDSVGFSPFHFFFFFLNTPERSVLLMCFIIQI